MSKSLPHRQLRGYGSAAVFIRMLPDPCGTLSLSRYMMPRSEFVGCCRTLPEVELGFG